MRVGILGGAFDPPHLGHLIMAQACLESARLDEVWWMPSAQPPHKSSKALSTWEHRLAMTRLAIVGNTSFRLETIEETLPAPNFTYQTLEALKSAHKNADFHLILGEDSLNDLPGWREPRLVLDRAELIVYPRPGAPAWNEALWWEKLGNPAKDTARLIWVKDAALVGIASRDLRKKVAAGQSIRYLVPRAVEIYLKQNDLYLPG